jgi:hypothetical protein
MYVENLSPQEEEKNKQQQVNAPTVGGGGGGAVAGGMAQTAGNFSTITPVQPQQPVQQWATAQDYLKANQPQAEGLGQKVQESLTGTLAGAKGAIETGAEQAKSDITAGATPFNEALVTEAKTTPTSVAGDEGKLKSFLSQWNASYQGPESFESSTSYAPAATAVQTGATKAAQLGSTGGREQLIGDQFGVYGAGNKGLDQAILQQAPQYENIQALAPQFTGLQDYLTQKSGEVGTAAGQAKAATEAAKQQTQGAFTGRLGEFQGQINKQTADAQKEAQTIADKYNVDLASGDPTAIVADLQAAGAADQDIARVSGLLQGLKQYNEVLGLQKRIVPTQVYGFNPSVDINTATVATPEQYAQAQALQKLTGADYSGILNPASAAQAGTAPNAKASLNAKTLQEYLTPLVGQMRTDVTTKDTGTLGEAAKGIAEANGFPATAEGGIQALYKYPEQMQVILNTLQRLNDPRYKEVLDAAIRQGFYTQPGGTGNGGVGTFNNNKFGAM